MTTQIQVNKFKFFPEVVFATDAEDFLSGGKTLIRLKSLNKRQQFVEPLSYAVDAVDNIAISHIEDLKSKPELDAGSLKGIAAEDQEISEFNPYAFIFDEYRLNASNNTGGTSADFRARLRYVVHQLTTVRKLSNKIALTARDREAIEILGPKGLNLVDIPAKFQIGFDLPKNFSEGFNDKNIGAVQRAYGDALNLSTGQRDEVMNFDVEQGQCVVLNILNFTVPIQAEVGEVKGFISRDDDDDLIEFDPAVFRGTTVSLPVHITAYKNITVEFQLVSGTHNDFKAYAGASIKRVGLMTKAKLQEFSEQDFPSSLGISSAENKLISELGLKELARVGTDVLRS